MRETVFTKYSGERSRRFAIRTDIVKENDSLAVEKYPLYLEGSTHIEKIYKWYHLLQEIYEKQEFFINACWKIPGGIRLEYLPGVTLQEEIRKQNEYQQERMIEAYIEQYLERMMGNQKWIPFTPTQEFFRVFGQVSLPEGLQCQKITNIDMIFSNIILEGEKWHVIDYEWTFDFPIPIHFVLYRAFFLAFHEIPGVPYLEFSHMMKRLGISEEEQRVYQKMEASFQEYVRGGEKPFRDLLFHMEQPVFPMEQVEQAFEGCSGLQFSISYYSNRKEIFSREVTGKMQKDNHIYFYCCPQQGAEQMKLGISPGSVMIWLKEVVVEKEDGQEEWIPMEQVESNGLVISENLYLVLSDKAWFQIPCLSVKSIRIVIKVQEIFLEMNQKLVPHITELHKKLKESYEEISYLKLRYDRVEHSKLFQAYLKAKELRNGRRKNGETEENE